MGRVPAGEVIEAGVFPPRAKDQPPRLCSRAIAASFACRTPIGISDQPVNWKLRDRGILQSVGPGALDISESEQTGNDPCRALTSNKWESRSPAVDQGALFINPWHSFLRTLAMGSVSCSCGRRAQGALAVSPMDVRDCLYHKAVGVRMEPGC